MSDAFTTNLNLDKPVVGGSADTWGTTNNANWDALDAMLGGAIYGLTLSTAGSSATFGIATGGASGMALASAYTKTTSAWAVGTAAGALDTGAIANSTWYHVYLIQRVDTGVVDILISLSATAPTMPTNYTRKRKIGKMKTNGSAQWILFNQLGDQFLWAVGVEDAVGVTPANANAASVTLSVPTGDQVEALIDVRSTYNSSLDFTLVTSLDQTDTAPDATHYTHFNSSTAAEVFRAYSIRTNTSGQIRWRSAASGGGAPGVIYYIFTRGWIDRRGQ